VMPLALVVFAFVVRARRRAREGVPGPVATIAGVVAAALLAVGAHLGGLMVLRGGAGVDSAVLAPEVRALHHHGDGEAADGHGEGEPKHEHQDRRPSSVGTAKTEAHAQGEHRTAEPREAAAPAPQHEHGASPPEEPKPRPHEHEGTPPREPKLAEGGHRHEPAPKGILIPPEGLPPGEPGKDYAPVVTPNGTALPWRIVDGAKVFHLVAEEVAHEFAPGLVARCWGYNGRVHGPTIEAVEGDRVRIYVTNRLPAPTSVHWHGLLLPNGMDGVAGLNQAAIQPGETCRYEFTLRQHGTHMYHPHHDEMTQMAMGLMGLFVIHPRARPEPPIDRDFAVVLSEWRIDVGTSRPDPLEMTDFNVVTLNGRVFPGTEPLVARLGQRVRIRFANLSAMDHHPMHVHGYQFRVVESDGGQIAPSAQQVETTVLVQVGSSKTIEFVADAAGDWAVHCHMTHHLMNQMGHGVPNVLGVDVRGFDERVRELLPDYMTMGTAGMGDMATMPMPVPANSIPMLGAKGPFGPISMGGMFTILKVRDGIADFADPGWYTHPEGTVARPASPEELRRDGIDAPATAPAAAPGTHRHGGSR
jgi:manganese oxidase